LLRVGADLLIPADLDFGGIMRAGLFVVARFSAPKALGGEPPHCEQDGPVGGLGSRGMRVEQLPGDEMIRLTETVKCGG
jgi:hypothetical protein